CEDRVFDGLFGLFADSLPDGWGRLLIDRHLMSQGIDFRSITPLDRLMMIGEFGTGALSYEPIIDTYKSDIDIDLDRLAHSSMQILKGVSANDIETLIANNGSSAGARPKIMVQINQKNQIISANQPLQKNYEHYMVKFASSTDHADIGKLEYVYSLMARDAGINISETKLLQGKYSSYFAIKRFDRVNDARVHMHSLAALVHSDFRMPSIDYDDILTLTLHLTHDIQEVQKVFKLAVFNLLTHNRDDHAKNFSYVLDSDNNWKFSPAYDLTFSNGPGGEHSTTYLGNGKNPTKKELLELAKKHTVKDAHTILDEIYSVTKNFKAYANEIGINQKYAADVFKQFIEIKT
ncbi:MAG: type II toxin-antitoxin system HipA family toxin, partial [Campylobacterales bacterium]|nr:type II toxin-antitoxin system HipA family toxin [Campylobacterales bacterium]